MDVAKIMQSPGAPSQAQPFPMEYKSELVACFHRSVSLNVQLGSIMMRGMVIDMNDKALNTLTRLRAFLDGTVAVSFVVVANERYDFITRTLHHFSYARLRRADKGINHFRSTQ